MNSESAEYVHIAARTWYKDTHEPRFRYALHTVLAARAAGFSVSLADASMAPVRALLKQAGARVEQQANPGMGNATREAILSALANASQEDAILLTEAEKYDIIRLAPAIVRPILSGEADIVVPQRTKESWSTYPDNQRESEQSANRLFQHYMCLPMDPMFGPVAFSTTAAHYFLEYKPGDCDIPEPYADRYDAHHIPPAIAHKSGARVVSVPVDFRFPPEQRLLEERDAGMREKRQLQLQELTSVYRAAGRVLFGESYCAMY